jgi:ornithine cyclodeaminase/alanine dehydrogenase-like protein (mu-crystallin family)
MPYCLTVACLSQAVILADFSKTMREGAVICNVSTMDLHKEVFVKAGKVVVDDWDQCNREKKVIHQLVLEGQFSRDQLHAELGEIIIGRRPGRESDDEIILLNPMGIAIEDVACAQVIYQRALAAQVGMWLSLY